MRRPCFHFSDKTANKPRLPLTSPKPYGFDALSQKFKEAEAQKDAVAQQISDILERRGMMEDFLRILKQQDGEVTAFSEKLWCGLLDYATAYADGRLTFTFKNGSSFEG